MSQVMGSIRWARPLCYFCLENDLGFPVGGGFRCRGSLGWFSSASKIIYGVQGRGRISGGV